MKKSLTLTLAAALALALSACGTPASPSSSGTETTPSPGMEENGTPASSGTADTEFIYGTATLTYAEFYSGDVTSTDSFDAVSSATASKYEIMPNMATDFVDEASNADGYHIIGVGNVNLAVPASDYEAYLAINPTFVPAEGTAVPAQYKTVTVSNGKAAYSETQFHIADTVTDATADLITGSTWGDYQINVTDGATVHLRNSREDEFDINSQIQGIILETSSGLKVGMEHLQSIWVQPYEVSFNVLEDNTHNTHIAAYDNLLELSKLVGETVTKITFIMPDAAYVYQFEGIYIKPIYTGTVTASVSADYDAITLSGSNLGDFENGILTVTYTLGSGRSREITTLLEASLTDSTSPYALNVSAIAGAESGGIYAAAISSDTYADVTVSLPMSDGQAEALNTILAAARGKLEENPDDTMLAAHIQEAEDLLAAKNASSSEAGSLIAELTQLTSAGEGQGGH